VGRSRVVRVARQPAHSAPPRSRNGRPCLLLYHNLLLYDTASPRRVSCGVFLSPSRLDIDAFRNRLGKTHRHWSRWARRAGIECYRVYDRDVPQFPLVVDRFAGHAHLQEVDTGWLLTPAEHARWVAAVVAVTAEALGIPASHVHYKLRARRPGGTPALRAPSRSPSIVVVEAGLRFVVDLDAHLDTGLFLDHRNTRAWVRARSAGRRFLNLFAYTGAFTVHAAAGGASSTTSVDLSNTYLDWTARNLALNALSGPAHALVRADVHEWLDQAATARRLFDLIVLDPPTFSNSARMRETLDIQRDHARLIGSALKLAAAGGELIFSTNRRGFKLDPSVESRFSCEPISRWTIPEDFRRHPPHATWRITANQ
jgi:23S rRNA (cytosine1962-C5)-methyltransferase